MQSSYVIEGEQLVGATVNEGHSLTVRQTRLRLPEDSDGPALAVERTTLPDGPKGPPIILVHGLAQNRFTWDLSRRSLVAYLAERGFDVLNVELRGHGNSRAYGSGNASSFNDYVDDLARVISRCERKPFLVGHSLGGAVILAAATRIPVAGLIPIAGVYTFATDNRTMRGIAKLTLRAERFLTFGRVRVSTNWAGGLIAGAYGLTDIAGYGLPFAGWTPGSIEQDILDERLRLGFDWTSIEAWLTLARWAQGEPFPYAKPFSELDVPLLVVAGDMDPLLSPKDAQNCYDASGSGDRQLVVFDAFQHEVHWGHLDLIIGRKAPSLVWPLLEAWIAKRT